VIIIVTYRVWGGYRVLLFDVILKNYFAYSYFIFLNIVDNK